MKLNDIFINLKKTIDISGNTNKDFKLSPILSENIDSFKVQLKKTLKLNKPKKIIIGKNKKSIDNISTKKAKTINLKNIIKKTFFFPHLKEKIDYLLLKIKNKKSKTKNKINKKNKTQKILKILATIFLIDFILASLFLYFGYNSLKNINSQNFQSQISKSKILFSISKNLFIPFYIIPTNTTKNFYYLASAGENINNFLDIITNIIQENKNSKIFPTDIIKQNQEKIQKSYIYLKNFENNFKKITFKNFDNIIKYTHLLTIIFEDFNKNPDRILNILGDKNIQKYIILFQNNDELRATGGFPGSVGIINIYKGRLIEFKKEDIYALEWNINKNYKNKLKAPEGINQTNPYFTLKDANYFSSYFSSANSINYFLQKGEYSFDGVIFINTNTINKILELIGGIYFENIKTTINSNNFNEIISTLVEAKVSKQGTLGTPKKILFDFSKKLEEKIKSKNNLIKVLKIILQDIENREIAIINFNPDNNQLFKKLGFNGEVNLDNYSNFIYPVFTSISQNKSDRYLKISYNTKTKIEKNNNNKCNYITDFNLNLKHGFNKKIEEKIKKYLKDFNIKNIDKILEIQGKGYNKQFIRFIIPKKSYIKTNNFINTLKNNNTNLVEIYTNLKPEEQTNINFSYIQKNKNCDNYSFKLVKQPGIKKYDLHFVLEKYGKQIKILNLKNLKKDFYYIEK